MTDGSSPDGADGPQQPPAPPPADAADHTAEDTADHRESPAGRPDDRPAPTGVAGADAARARLQQLAGAPLEEHVEVFEDAHRRLQEGLADLDDPS